MLTYKDIQDKYKVSRGTVYNWILAGMPYCKIGRLVRFNEKDVSEWIQNKK